MDHIRKLHANRQRRQDHEYTPSNWHVDIKKTEQLACEHGKRRKRDIYTLRIYGHQGGLQGGLQGGFAAEGMARRITAGGLEEKLSKTKEEGAKEQQNDMRNERTKARSGLPIRYPAHPPVDRCRETTVMKLVISRGVLEKD